MLQSKVNGVIRRIPAWPIYIIFPLPGLFLFWQALGDKLGANPIQVLEHAYGERGLQLIILALLITPIHRLAGINLIKFRRAIGVIAFVYVLAHMLTWLVLDQGLDMAMIVTEIIRRPYITIGMVGFVALIPLVITSNNLSLRRLGPKRWRRIHQLTYFVAVAGAVHYLMVVKAWPTEPIVYAFIVLSLLAIRFWWKVKARGRH